jgi:hypothetical protein
MTADMLTRPRTRFGRSSGWILAQTCIVVFVIAAPLMPPASGSILLLPIASGHSGSVLQQALDRGARLEMAGPIAGTFVVHAERDRLAAAMLRAGVLMLAAQPPLCGKAKRSAA